MAEERATPVLAMTNENNIKITLRFTVDGRRATDDQVERIARQIGITLERKLAFSKWSCAISALASDRLADQGALSCAAGKVEV